MVTDLPAPATCSPWVSASRAALSISMALSPTEAMKCEAVATFSVIWPVVWFCSVTEPLTLSNTGRIACMACEIRCTASTEPAASLCSASIFFLISSVASWVCTASALTSEATTAKPRPAAPARAASIVELSASSVVCRAICAIKLTTLPIAAEDSFSRSTLALASSTAASGLIGELAGLAHLRADVFGRMGELVGGLREDLGGALRGAASSAERSGALADHGKGRSRSLGPAGDGTRRALELADHSTEFEFEQFEDLPGRIDVGRNRELDRRFGLHRLRPGRWRGRFSRASSE